MAWGNGTSERAEAGRRPSPGAAIGLVVAVAALYVVGGIPLQLLLGETGLLLSQLLFLAVPAVLFVKLFGYDVRATLSLRMPSGSQVVAGVIVLAGATQIAWFLAWLQSFFLPVPVEYLETMAEMLTADSAWRFVQLMLLVAVLPAVAEELVFRGVLLGGLRTRMPAIAAAVVTGLVFGLFHVSPQTGFRILPTAWLGIVLAWVVIASGSLPLAMLLHLLNNGALLALAALPATRELATGTESAPPIVLLPGALVLFVWGVVMLGRRSGRSRAAAPPGTAAEAPGPFDRDSGSG